MGQPPCRVILNDRCLRQPRTGVGRYVTQVVAGLARVAPDVRVFPFYSRLRGRRLGEKAPTGLTAGDGTRSRARFAAMRPSTALRRTAQSLYETAFELAGSIGSFSLYHEPNHIPSPWQGPILTTIHDLSVLVHPEWHPPDRVAWYARDFESGLARTHHFISVSQFTRGEMIRRLHIDESRISVIPLAAQPIFRPLPAEASATGCRQLGVEPGFLLYVGTLEPRKNLPGLLAAYASLPRPLQERHPLVLVGLPGWGRDDLLAIALSHGIQDRLRILGYVPDELLPCVYSAAHALVWPTLYEGFGLPPLEAMACGTPVITSSVSSLPEVVGDAGLLVDPRSTEQIAEAMRRILEDPALRTALSARSLIRAGAFSWDRCALAHADVYRRLSES